MCLSDSARGAETSHPLSIVQTSIRWIRLPGIIVKGCPKSGRPLRYHPADPVLVCDFKSATY